MTSHPLRDVAIVGVYNSRQARMLEGDNSETIALRAALGAVADAGLTPRDIDGVIGTGGATDFVYQNRIGPVWRSMSGAGIPAVLEAAVGHRRRLRHDGPHRGGYRRRLHRAGRHRPVDPAVPRVRRRLRHVHRGGVRPRGPSAHGDLRHHDRALATVAATIRNNGHVNPEAVYYGRGPFTPQDILDSRMIADPFHLLDCAMTSEGGCALVLARAEVAA